MCLWKSSACQPPHCSPRHHPVPRRRMTPPVWSFQSQSLNPRPSCGHPNLQAAKVGTTCVLFDRVMFSAALLCLSHIGQTLDADSVQDTSGIVLQELRSPSLALPSVVRPGSRQRSRASSPRHSRRTSVSSHSVSNPPPPSASSPVPVCPTMWLTRCCTARRSPPQTHARWELCYTRSCHHRHHHHPQAPCSPPRFQNPC